jgi:hypothetical protein
VSDIWKDADEKEESPQASIRREEFNRDRRDIASLCERTEWNTFVRYLTQIASTHKLQLYNEDMSGHDFKAGRHVGWLAAIEYVVQTPSNFSKKITKETSDVETRRTS